MKRKIFFVALLCYILFVGLRRQKHSRPQKPLQKAPYRRKLQPKKATAEDSTESADNE